MMRKPLATILLAAGLSASVAAPAFAQTSNAPRIAINSASVSVSDLDLSTEHGERKMRNRVAAAVRQVCRVADGETGHRVMSRDARECLAKARASANQQMAALLTDEQRGG